MTGHALSRHAISGRKATKNLPCSWRTHPDVIRATFSNPRRCVASVACDGSSPSCPSGRGTVSRFKAGAAKEEGSIASVFASLSGEESALPARFQLLKRDLVPDEQHALHLRRTWNSVLQSVRELVDLAGKAQGDLIPYVQYSASREWLAASDIRDIKKRGVAVIKNVVDRDVAIRWKQDVLDYAAANPVRGFPEANPQVFEMYWSKPQLAARSNSALMDVSRKFLKLFHQRSSGLEAHQTAALGHPLTYADRLRVRQPGDAKFTLGAHIDGGGVERWECPSFRSLFHNILRHPVTGSTTMATEDVGDNWKKHDPFDLGNYGERLLANGSMYDGPGQCSVFRPWQGWLALSETRTNEGTLRVLPFLKESSAYIMLRPFFRPRQEQASCDSRAAFLAEENWELDLSSSEFPGCSLGHNIELSHLTHPHLELETSLVSIPEVNPGDMVLWHCDLVHAVESKHSGQGDSSVMYIPAIPLTLNNLDYVVRAQKDQFLHGRPPWDFPGGRGESDFAGRGTVEDLVTPQARQAMGLQRFDVRSATTPAERQLLEQCNKEL